MNTVAQQATAPSSPQAPRAPVDADRLAQQIEQQVQQALEQGLGTTEQAQTARDQVRAAMEQLRAELAEARSQGRSFTTTQVPFDPNNIIPPQAVDISLAFFAMVAFIVVGLPLARAFARRMDRKGQAAVADPEVSPRLQRIEQAVDAISLEVERISENQRYSTKVISELRGLPASSAGGWAQGREAESVPREGQVRRP